jgi:hypothetical protein
MVYYRRAQPVAREQHAVHETVLCCPRSHLESEIERRRNFEKL